MRIFDARRLRRWGAIAIFGSTLSSCSTEPVAARVAADAPAGQPPASEPKSEIGQHPPRAVSAHELPADAVQIPAPPVEVLPVPDARTIELEPPRVDLVSKGAEPQIALRLQPPKKGSATVELVMQMSMGMRVGSNDVAPTKLPEIRVGMTTLVDTLARDRVEYEFVVTSVERQADADVSARVLDAVDRAVTGMRETKGRMTLNRRGRVEGSSLGLPDLSTPGLRPTLSGFTQSFAQLYPVFPEEPVGVGASWTSTEQFELSGIPVQQKSTYTLLSNDDSVLVLEVEFDQAAIGKVKSPEQLDMAVTAFGGRGTGTITFDLRSVVPRKASSSSATQTLSTVSLGSGGEGVRMDLVLELAISSS